jgi:hypothetical protein
MLLNYSTQGYERPFDDKKQGNAFYLFRSTRMAIVQESLICLIFYPNLRKKHHPTIHGWFEEGMYVLCEKNSLDEISSQYRFSLCPLYRPFFQRMSRVASATVLRAG